MQISAPAKINLHLRVGPPRPDGFHPLMTWMTTIGLFDTLTFTPAENGVCPGFPEKGDRPRFSGISMTCSDSTLPTDDRNLVVKAAKLLRGDRSESVAIHLEKKVPHGGGLGGGSADAAFTLSALNQLWKLGKTADELNETAAKLGSDISFFLYGPSSICRGRGEVVRPIAVPSKAKWVVLILPDLSMPTPAVYRQFDAMKLGDNSTVDIEPDWNQWAALSSQDLLRQLVNDLEPPAFAIEPKLGVLRSEIESHLGQIVRMSGSGSSLFTLYDHQDEAASAATKIAGKFGVRALAVEICPAI
jgi:4-diphosphocytidyl-2-C-methyl-D-erythritol kinase